MYCTSISLIFRKRKRKPREKQKNDVHCYFAERLTVWEELIFVRTILIELQSSKYRGLDKLFICAEAFLVGAVSAKLINLRGPDVPAILTSNGNRYSCLNLVALYLCVIIYNTGYSKRSTDDRNSNEKIFYKIISFHLWYISIADPGKS